MSVAKIPSVNVLAQARRRVADANAAAAEHTQPTQAQGTSITTAQPSAPNPRINREDRVTPARIADPETETPLFTSEQWEATRSAAFRGEAHEALALGVPEHGQPLVPMAIPRRAVGAHDVVLDLEFCGLCHSDVHTGRGEWGQRALPIVLGHEMVGRIAALGSGVANREVGDRVGVGCMVGACRTCPSCQAGDEQYCHHGSTGTYGGWDHPHAERTQGGYSTSIVVPEDFILTVPEGLEPAETAPLLCAGITMYAPLEDLRVGPGDHVAVAGLGGLGHMAVKIAVAMGAEVTVITRSQHKAADAHRLGADNVLVSTDDDALSGAAGTFNVLIDAISAPHSVEEFLHLLVPRGAVVLAGLPADTDDDAMPALDPRALVGRGLKLMGTKIGGLEQTQRMLDFCAAHQVTPDIEVVTSQDVNSAWDRMVAGDIRYRGVLDIGSLEAHPHTGAPPACASLNDVSTD